MLDALRRIGKKLGKRRRVNAVMLALLLLLASIAGATYSFYTKDVAIENALLTKGSEVFLQELFNPEDKWLPGETKAKEVTFGNQFETDQIIRFTYTVDWFEKDANGVLIPWPSSNWVDARGEYGQVLPLENFVKGVKLIWASTFEGEWLMQETADSPYYYYRKVLKAKTGNTPTLTNPTLKAVTFSETFANNSYYSGDDFSNKRCVITLRLESVDASKDAVLETWGKDCTISGDSVIWN